MRLSNSQKKLWCTAQQTPPPYCHVAKCQNQQFHYIFNRQVAAQDCQKTTIKPNSYGLDAPPNNPEISVKKSVMGRKTI